MAWLILSAVADKPVGFQSLAKPLLNLLVAAAGLALACWLIRWIVSPDVLANPGLSPASVVRATGR
jgi:hypothetical protein